VEDVTVKTHRNRSAHQFPSRKKRK
jgi:hypothetical protein